MSASHLAPRARPEHLIAFFQADGALGRFPIDGMPDPGRLRAVMVTLIEQACRGRQDCVVRGYGQMGDVLTPCTYRHGHRRHVDADYGCVRARFR